jgi:biopolymer transport protein ExbD
MSKTNSDFGRLNKPRSKKLNAKIDLTAMVSISFLLIIFFMLTQELSKPRSLALGLPEKYSYTSTCRIICGNGKSRVITLISDDNDKIICYTGLLELQEASPKLLSYGKEGIRKELLLKSKQIQNYTSSFGRHNSGAIVIIKPSKKSNFKNLVDILDEMNITNIPTYAIINDYTPEEVKLLASN